MNNVALIGRLVRDPELRFTPGNGKAVTNFTLAVDRGLSKDKKAEMEQKGHATADFIPIVIWGKSAENCANFLVKGRLVAIQGSIQTSTFEDKDKNKRYKTEILASNVEFLEWGDKSGRKEDTSEDFSYGDFVPVDEMDSEIPF